MPYFPSKKRSGLINRSLSLCCIFAFVVNLLVLPVSVQGQAPVEAGFSLPLPGTMLTQTQFYSPPTMTGVVINPEDPLEFEFMITQGDAGLDGEAFQKESEKLIKYFLSTLTIPEEKLWVNLSPYERDQMISPVFGETEMGRDLLGQDYLLKQLSASLMNPKDELGKKFWDRVYAKAYEVFQTKDIPVNTFNKVWIVPEKADIYENETGAFIVDSHLKVMLEEDYLALQKNMKNEDLGLNTMGKDDAEQISQVTTQVIREVMLPEIEKEVNEGSTFANLRQIYNAMILGAWYKKSLKESFLGQVYVDQNKIAGIDLNDPTVKQKIFDQYLVAFQKGVYNYMERNFDPQTNEIVIQKYFSGGFTAAALPSLLKHNPLASLNPEQLAAAASPIMSSSFTGKGDIFDRFNSFSPARKIQFQSELARLETSSPVKKVTVKFASQEGERSFRQRVGDEFSNLRADTAASLIELDQIVYDALIKTNNGGYPQIVRGGRIQIIDTNDESFKNIAELAAISNVQAARITDSGDVMEVRFEGGQARDVGRMDPVRLVESINAGTGPMMIAESPQAVTRFYEAAPQVAAAVMLQAALSSQLSNEVRRGTVQFAPTPAVATAMFEEASSRGMPVARIMDSGDVMEVRFERGQARDVGRMDPVGLAESINAGTGPMMIAESPQAVTRFYEAASQAAAAVMRRTVERDTIATTKLSKVTQETRLHFNLEKVLTQGSASVNIPQSVMNQLNQQPAFREAAVRVQKLESGEITLPKAQEGDIVANLDNGIRGSMRRFETAETIGERETAFYEIQAMAAKREQLLGKDANAPLFGLTPQEIVAVNTGQFDINQLGKTRETLFNHQAALHRLEGVLSSSGTPKGTEFRPVINKYIERLTEQIASIDKYVALDGKIQDINEGRTEARVALLEGSTISKNIPDSVQAIKESPGPIIALSPQGARPIDQGEAITALEFNSKVHKTLSGVTVVEPGSSRKFLNPSDSAAIRSFQPQGIPKVDVNKTLARLNVTPDVGGIDLNPSLMDLNIKKDGKGVTLPLLQQSMELINSIQGFVPVITDISPATFNMPMILGQEDSGKDDSSKPSYQAAPVTSMAGGY